MKTTEFRGRAVPPTAASELGHHPLAKNAYDIAEDLGHDLARVRSWIGAAT